jgi:ABC-type antimicrobial peptide transport system permease subunit
MFRNYIKTAIRNLRRHRADTAVNLLGLIVAFTSALLLFLSVYYEFSFDRFHENRDRLYRTYISANSAKNSSLPAPLIPTLKAAYPEVQYATRFVNLSGEIKWEDKMLVTNLRYTDPDFLRMFSFPMLSGSPSNALNGLNNVILSRGMAHAIFGVEPALGKVVRINSGGEWKSFTVTGVLENNPEASSIRYDVILRFEQQPDYAAYANDWGNWNHDAFVQLRAGAKAEDFGRRTAPFMRQYFAEDIERLKRDGAKKDEGGNYMQLGLQPLVHIHTDTELAVPGSNNISRSYLYMLLVIGLLIVAIACINFINLRIGYAFVRSREIGVRKALGAQRRQIAGQFLAEAFILCLASFFISAIACYVITPHYRQLFAMNISRSLLLSPATWVACAFAFTIITLLAGGYPAWVVARFNTVKVLKGKLSMSQSRGIRNPLIVLQFSIATLLIACTIIAWQQIDFLRSQPLGYNRDQIISIPIGNAPDPGRVLRLMRNKLASEAAVESVTGIYDNLGKGTDGSSRRSKMGFDHRNREVKCTWMGVTYDFVKTLDLQLVAGRDFSSAMPTDSTAVVINEAMARQLGEKQVIGTLLNVHEGEAPLRVIGVVKDFHYQSLHSRIDPLTLVIDPRFDVHYILVRVKPSSLSSSMDMLRNAWKQVMPGAEFQASFLDENIERQYQREEKLGKIFTYGTMIAILLSCMGLLAIVTLILAQSTREIGIRKVLGATVSGIVGFVFKDFLKLVAIAISIALPIAWLAANSWLQDFSYRIALQWWVFAAAGGITIAIAFLTVLARTLKAALANPVKSIRTE